jgi:hypothetical protein
MYDLIACQQHDGLSDWAGVLILALCLLFLGFVVWRVTRDDS